MTQPSTLPTRSPECAAIGPLLPLLAHDMLDDSRATRVRAHLATCAACRAELAQHDLVDAALRRAAGPPVAIANGMPFARQELLALTQDTRETTSPLAPARRATWRRIVAGVPAVAAVLLLALLARYIFSLGPRSGAPGPGPAVTSTTSSPAAVLPPNLDIKSIGMVGNEAQWAVGSTVPDPKCVTGGCGTSATPYVQPVMLFLQAGRWERYLALPALHRPDYSWELNSVALSSPTEGWAVGNTVLPPGADGITFGILLHLSGGQWSIADLNLGARLAAVVMCSPTDGWIAGTDASGNPLVLDYTGGAWVPVHAAAFAGLRLTAIATPVPNQVWMVGIDESGSGYDGNARSVILHYDGVNWTRQANPSPHTWLQGLAMISPSEGWAVGGEQFASPSGGPGTTPDVARILHYHNGVWQVQASFSAPSVAVSPFMLNAVAMTTDADGWAVGTSGLMLHYDGVHWTQAPALTTHDLNAIALPCGCGSGDGWAMGSPTTVLHVMLGRWSAYIAGA